MMKGVVGGALRHPCDSFVAQDEGRKRFGAGAWGLSACSETRPNRCENVALM